MVKIIHMIVSTFFFSERISGSGGPGPQRALAGPSCQVFRAHMWAQRADQGPLIYEGFYIGSKLGAQLGQP